MNATLPSDAPRASGTASLLAEMIDLTIGELESPETVVVEAVNWRIAVGDYWVVGGLPGSGKSNLLATAAGLNPPLRGILRLFGRDAGALTEEDLLEVRLRVGLVFENGGRLFNHLSVVENVALPLCYHRNCPPSDVRERVAQILEFSGLTPLANQTPGRIRPAWQQRVALARALATGPEVLLLDNPLAGLGPQEARWWRGVLPALLAGHAITGGRPVALVVTCHDLRPWADQANRFALLKQRHWLPIGGQTDLARCGEPVLRELMAADFKAG